MTNRGSNHGARSITFSPVMSALGVALHSPLTTMMVRQRQALEGTGKCMALRSVVVKIGPAVKLHLAMLKSLIDLVLLTLEPRALPVRLPGTFRLVISAINYRHV